jgi:hypothetical protein
MGIGDGERLGVRVGEVPGEMGTAVCVGDTVGVGLDDGETFGPNGMMLRAKSGTNVATKTMTITAMAMRPFFLPLPVFIGGDGGGGGGGNG